MVEQIKKRNGEIESFDINKIRNVIHKANLSVDDERISNIMLNSLADTVVNAIDEGTVPTVEQVQDLVEEALIHANYPKTAKAYILYRAEHAKMRETGEDLMDIFNQLTFAYAKDADIKRENANIDADTAMGTMLKYGSEGSKYYIDKCILPKDIAEAHINGDIHIHDKDFYMLTETCCQIDLIKLFKNGFSTGHGYLREPNSIASYSALGCIAIQANQNEMHGGQAVPNFDYSMAPGVAKTFVTEYFTALANYIEFCVDKDIKSIRAEIKQIRKSLEVVPNIDDDRNFVEGFADVILPKLREWGCESIQTLEDLKRVHAKCQSIAIVETDRATYQAMEALIHNLNTMNSRAGAQVPFSSINYGTDTSSEARMVIKNLLLATDAGLGNGETPIFPVQIFKVKEGINYNPEDKNYDLYKLAIKTSAKRLFPNFSFIDAPFNLQYYKEGDYNTEIAYMGCRTRVMGNNYDKSREATCGRGNLSFTSVNLPRIAILAKGDIKKFYELLDERIDLVIMQLKHRLQIQSRKKARNYPFLMGQGIWLDSENLNADDSVAEVIKHGTLSMGFIGLAETLKALTGKHHGESADSQKLGLEIISYMRKRMDEESEKTGLNFSLIATPAEGLSGRFVKIDRDRFGVIEGVTDRDYYTNSFHVPVYYNISIYDKIKTEAPYHSFTNGGHISYVELDGDTCKNLDAFETVIRCMKEAGIGYGSVNHPVDRDPICGYTGVIDDVCPRCGRREGEALTPEKVRELRKHFPTMPVLNNLED